MGKNKSVLDKIACMLLEAKVVVGGSKAKLGSGWVVHPAMRKVHLVLYKRPLYMPFTFIYLSKGLKQLITF